MLEFRLLGWFSALVMDATVAVAPTPPVAPPRPAPAPASAPAAPAPAAPAPTPAVAADPFAADPDEPVTVESLSGKISALESRLDQTESLITGRRPTLSLGGYADFGFFAPQGNGSGIIRDDGNRIFPGYEGRYGWVFLGDLLAPTVNSRGEAASLGDPAGVMRHDSIHSDGAASFILNEINLNLTGGVGDNLVGNVSVNFVPRSGQDFALGDFVDIDLAQVEWLPFASRNTSIFVGKVDSVLGIEYRERKASQRFGITPSLMGRYTMGTALGVKIRSKFFKDENLVVAGALTNGSFTTEQFHFFDEIDSNAGKTGSARVALRTAPRRWGVEVGASGSYGAQDRAPASREPMWFVGADLITHLGPLVGKAQWLKGRSAGWGENVYGLDLRNGGYLELDFMLTPAIGLLARGEFRDAFVWLGDPAADVGANRAYLTKSWRATAGARVVFSDRVLLKAEYLYNGEYGGIPQIRNDIFTSSLVFIN